MNVTSPVNLSLANVTSPVNLLCSSISGFSELQNNKTSTSDSDSMCSSSIANTIEIVIDSPSDSNIITSDCTSQTAIECLVGALKTQDSAQLWHMRLGHPSSKIFTNFLRLHNHPVTHDTSLCQACAIGKSKKLPHSTSTTVYK